MARSRYTGKEAREIIKNMSAGEIKKLSWDDMIDLAKAGQNEVRNDMRRFRKAGVERGAFAFMKFKDATSPHDYTYTYYSIKEHKDIEKTVHVDPGVRFMSRINERKSASDLAIYLMRLDNYFNAETATVEGIDRHDRYIRYFMGGGDAITDENGKAVDWIPREDFSEEDVAAFYKMYDAARREYGREFAAFYQSIRDAIVYNMRNGGENNFRTMTPEEVAKFLHNNPDYVDDPSETLGKDDAFA